MKIRSCFLVLLLALSTPLAAQSFTLDFVADPVIADPSGQISVIEVGFTSDTATEALGISLFYAYDPALLHVFGASSILPLSPSFFSTQWLNEPFTHPTTGVVTPAGVGLLGCVFDFALIDTLFVLPGTSTPVMRLSVLGGPGAFPGATSDLFFADGLNMPTQGSTTNVVVWRPSPTDAPVETSIDLSSGSVPLQFILPSFARGDVNGDNAVQIVDAILILQFLFLSVPIDCVAAADINSDGSTGLVDAISLLNYLFLSGPPPIGVTCQGQALNGLSCNAQTVCP